MTATWTPPSNSAVAGVTNYIVQYSVNAGTTWTTWTTTTGTTATVTGLTNGVPVRIRVGANNMDGFGSYETSDPITPAGLPLAPVVSSVGSSSGQAIAYFTLSANGSPITNVQYSLSTSPTTFSWSNFSPIATTSPATITGLTNGVTYYVALRAVNDVGTGPASSVSTVVPRGLPGPPTITGFSSGSSVSYGGLYLRWRVTYYTNISFTAPSSDGGSPITSYDISIDNGASVWLNTTNTSTSQSFGSSVSSGRLIRMRAITAPGTGPWSAPFNY